MQGDASEKAFESATPQGLDFPQHYPTQAQEAQGAYSHQGVSHPGWTMQDMERLISSVDQGKPVLACVYERTEAIK